MTEKEDPTLLADGLEEAFIGYVDIVNHPVVAVYDRDKCINIFIERDGMTYEEAIEYFNYNVLGAYMGRGTPIFLNKCSLEEFNEEIVE